METSRKLTILFAWPSVTFDQTLNFIPLGIGYIAANLPDFCQAFMWDGALGNLPDEDILHVIEDLNPEILAFSVWRFNSEKARKLAALAKNKFPDLTIIAGGPEPSANAELFMADNQQFDYLIAGEGEKTFSELLESLYNNETGYDRLSHICGLSFRNGVEIHTVKTEWVRWDDLKNCNYGFIQFDKYLAKGYSYGFSDNNDFTAPILTTRGCPYSCEYCSARKVNGLKVRLKKPESILCEIKILYDKYNVRNFNIIDDNFTFDMDFSKTVCRGILDLKLSGVRFCSPNGVRMEKLDKELLELMKEAKWEWIFIAPESGSEKTLRNMKKALNLNTVTDKIALIKGVGLKVFGFFIIGYPGETISDIFKTFFFAIFNRFDSVVFTCFQPLPGTPVYEKLEREGKLKNWKPGNDYYEVTYAPEGLSKGLLKFLRLAALLAFYFSTPGRIITMLKAKSIKSKLVFIRKLLFSK